MSAGHSSCCKRRSWRLWASATGRSSCCGKGWQWEWAWSCLEGECLATRTWSPCSDIRRSRSYLDPRGEGSQNVPFFCRSTSPCSRHPPPAPGRRSRETGPLLEVLQPPVLAPRLQIGVPAAGEVEQQDRDGPDEIEQSQTPGVTVRGWRIPHRMIGEQPRAHLTQPELRD